MHLFFFLQNKLTKFILRILNRNMIIEQELKKNIDFDSYIFNHIINFIDFIYAFYRKK
jgi:hypothetical protein